jgi:hypothetical protein
MKISVGNNQQYKYLKLNIDNTNINTGLLDEEEAADLAKDLISAAEDLLANSNPDLGNILCAVREAVV